MCTKYRPPNPKAIKRQMGFIFGHTISDKDIRPTDLAPMVGRGKYGDLSGSLASFGMMGNWDGSNKAKPLANVRQETIVESSTFTQAYNQRRCIVPAEGFYEWKEVDGKKVLYYSTRSDGLLFNFAGVWQREGSGIFSFSIITTTPNDVVARYHSRMPVAVENIESWLDERDPLKSIVPTPNEMYRASEVHTTPTPMPLFEAQL